MEALSFDQPSALNLSVQSLIEIIPSAAYAVRAPDGVIAWFNSRAVELWGREPVAGDSDERFCGAHRLYYPDGRYMAHSQTPVALALETGASVHEEDVVIERPDGSRVTVCVHIDPIRDASGTIVGAVNFFYDVTERKARETGIKTQAEQLELAVEERTASLSALSRRLMHIQDEERRRISRELHDCVGQHLALAKMSVDALARKTATEHSDPSTLLNLAHEAQARLDSALEETRTISFLFHPPLLDEFGFSAAVHSFAEGFSVRSGIKVEVGIPVNLPRLPELMETALFRIVQETLTNVYRHSGASKATVSLTMNDGTLRLVVGDNGNGFASRKTESLSVGLAGIRERLRELEGTLQIQSERGSRIIAEVPVNFAAKSKAP